MRRLIVILVLALIVVSCKPGEQKAVSLTAPFIGGTQGLSVAFQDFRADVFDGGLDPFDVIVKLENKGEALVAKEDVKVKLSGINPAEFDKSEADLTKNAPDDIIENRLQETGVLPGPPVFVDFIGLNHKGSIAGASAGFTLRADVCYLYRTRAVSKLCVRENLLTPRAGGICEINEAKPVYNSGAPIQISKFEEIARAKDKLGFSFEIKNVGSGNVFERNSKCDRSERRFENRVYVAIGTGLPGLSCTGLESTALGVEGFVTLYGGSKIISCAQPISTRSDFEQIVGVEVVYDYEQSIQSTFNVKSSGE
ncbi:hypothetical protein KY309_02755 [Candidatus Woesearchaeota archaeon]|nr:hypothetical protein [Candidatus Woesearchaeota archaeon]MBW3016505.1 hypothetical protein [Candidatus Woesearchaeota archaeon]